MTTGTLGGLAFIEVGNTGRVLDPDEIPALFEPFQRGREHRSDGTGLGLAVVRAITLTHHGELTATPAPTAASLSESNCPPHKWNRSFRVRPLRIQRFGTSDLRRYKARAVSRVADQKSHSRPGSTGLISG